jgi:hypothetical protein
MSGSVEMIGYGTLRNFIAENVDAIRYHAFLCRFKEVRNLVGPVEPIVRGHVMGFGEEGLPFHLRNVVIESDQLLVREGYARGLEDVITSIGELEKYIAGGCVKIIQEINRIRQMSHFTVPTYEIRSSEAFNNHESLQTRSVTFDPEDLYADMRMLWEHTRADGFFESKGQELIYKYNADRFRFLVKVVFSV